MPPSTPRRPCSRCGLKKLETSYTSARGKLCSVCRKKSGRTHARGSRIQSTYGITLKEYDAILAFQSGGCGGCARPPRAGENFDVDHDHALEKAGYPLRAQIRGLLCRACNRKVLPYARNNPETLKRLADYLENPPAMAVLK